MTNMVNLTLRYLVMKVSMFLLKFVADRTAVRIRLSVSLFVCLSAKVCIATRNAQNPLHTFARNFPVGCQLVTDLLATRQTTLTCQAAASTSATSWQQVVVMEFGKRHDTTDTTDFYPRQLVTDLLRGNWCTVMDCGLNRLKNQLGHF